MSLGLIAPGATLGVLGSGQLGRMFAMAARRLGYGVHVYSPEAMTPAGAVSDMEFVGEYDDLDRVAQFAKGVAAVTFEFENVLAATADVCERTARVRPAGRVLQITQHRLREKSFFRDAGLPVTPFAVATTQPELEHAMATLGLPGVLKTAEWGYDGKGQRRVNDAAAARLAHAEFGGHPVIYESLVDFEAELSVVGVRGADGEFVSYGPIRNHHVNHILDTSVLPGGFSAEVDRRAIEIARNALEALDVVGLLCLEFFLTRDGRLLINESAPRPHNSGHLTLDACRTCQFEQQVRALCGLPLGDARLLTGAGAMVNLLGDVWSHGEPNWCAALQERSLKLHLYGKAEARAGRKMGHINAVGSSPEDALARVRQAREVLRAPKVPH